MSATEVVWGAPPPIRRHWAQEFFEALAERPGEWARLPRTYPRRDEHGRIRSAAARFGLRVEITSRTEGDVWAYWARVVEP